MKPLTVRAAEDLLAFYIEAGVDVALGEAPIDRFAERSPDAAIASGNVARTPRIGDRVDTASEHERSWPRLPPKATRVNEAATPAPPAPEVAVMAAREAARRAASLEELRAILEGF